MLQDMRIAKAYLYILIFFTLLVSFPVVNHIALFYPNRALAQTSQGTSSIYLPYNNSTYGIRMQYPADWENKEKIASSTSYINDTILVARFIPKDQSVSVAVSIEKSQENVTLDQYIEKYIASHNDTSSNFQLVELNKTTTHGGTPGYKLFYHVQFDFPKSLKSLGLTHVKASIMEFIAIEGDNIYKVAYSNLVRSLFNQSDRELLTSTPSVSSGPATLSGGEGYQTVHEAIQGKPASLPQPGPSIPAYPLPGPIRESPAPFNPPFGINEQFLGHLPVAQKMIDSFEITR